jgi:hypothetical protein
MMKTAKRWLLVLALVVSSWPVHAADAALGLGTLNRWVGGKWVGSGQFVDSDYSSANKATSVTRCAWSPDHVFVICDQDVVFGGTPMQDLSVYSFASKAGKFYFYGISRGEEKPRSTGLEITQNGDRWTYSNSSEIKGKTVQFRTVNQFHGNDNVEWWSEFSADFGKTWTKTGQGNETRQ